MPAENVPFIIAVLVFFGIFMAVVGGVSIWSYLPPRKPAPAAAMTVPDFAHPAT